MGKDRKRQRKANRRVKFPFFFSNSFFVFFFLRGNLVSIEFSILAEKILNTQPAFVLFRLKKFHSVQRGVPIPRCPLQDDPDFVLFRLKKANSVQRGVPIHQVSVPGRSRLYFIPTKTSQLGPSQVEKGKNKLTLFSLFFHN